MAVDMEENSILYEDLAALENDFDDAELEILRKQHELYAPLYARRAELTSRIPHFWPTVLEQVPPEIDNWIQPSDSALLADSLTNLTITRFEIDAPGGSPRSFSVRFEFSANDAFDDTVLEKRFWFRRARDGWAGLVSEPVRIAWKPGHDLTGGLTDAAAALFDARQKLAKAAGGTGKAAEVAKHAAAGAGAGQQQQPKEYDALVRKIEESDETSLSFFAWFSFVSAHRFVDAAESAEASAREAAERARRRKGEKIDDRDEDEDAEDDEGHLEIHPAGEDLALLIADDLWPSAIKYFTSAREADDEPFSDLEVSDAADESDDDGDGDRMVDIRALVGKGKRAKGGEQSVSPPPAKKLR